MPRILKVIIILALIWWGAFWVYKWYQYYINKDNWNLEIDINKFNENLATEVVREDMVSNLNFVWSTKIKNQQKLKFNYEARVTWVYKKAWDSVKEWELIAELDKSQITSQIEIYKLWVKNSEVKLKKLLENTSEIEVEKSQIALDKLKKELENTKKNITFLEEENQNKVNDMVKTLRQKESEYRVLKAETKINLKEINLTPEQKEQELNKSKNSLSTLQTEYERDSRDFDINYKKKETEYYSTIEKEYIDIDTNLQSLDKSFNDLDVLLKVNPKNNYSNNYWIYFSAKNSSYKNKWTVYFQSAFWYFQDLQNAYKNIKDKKDINKLIELNDIQLKMYEDLAVAWEQLMKWLDNSIESEEFSSSVISWFYSTASSLYTNSNSKVLDLRKLPLELKTLKKPEEIKIDMTNQLQAKKDQIEDLKLSIQKLEDGVGLAVNTNDDKIEQESKKLSDKEQEIKNYKLEIDKTKVNIAYELESKKKSITENELAIKEAEKNLKNLLDDSSNQDVIFAQNDLKQARISLENEVKKLETYEIRAPFDAIITKMDYQIWDNLTQNDEKYILLENPDMLEISIFADQVDVMKLSKNQVAIVTYDAFPWVEFKWKIIDIDSTPQDKDWVTKYEVKIFLEKWEQTIYSWMKAQVNIVINEMKWVIAIPFSAINTDPESWETFVVVLNKSWKKEKRSVVVWYSDWNMTEITEWLEEWEKVLSIDYDSNYYKPEDFWTEGEAVNF